MDTCQFGLFGLAVMGQAPLLQPTPQLTTLVGLDTRVPGQGNMTFTQLGEGLFDRV